MLAQDGVINGCERITSHEVYVASGRTDADTANRACTDVQYCRRPRRQFRDVTVYKWRRRHRSPFVVLWLKRSLSFDKVVPIPYLVFYPCEPFLGELLVGTSLVIQHLIFLI